MPNNLGNKQTMADNIIYYMKQKGKTRADLCKDLGFKYTTIVGWITAKKYPRIDKIEILAKYFGVSKADLIEERTASPDIKSPVVTDEALEAAMRISQLRAENRKRMLDYLGLLESQENK